jgi:hypothetical protein
MRAMNDKVQEHNRRYNYREEEEEEEEEEERERSYLSCP